MWRHTGQAALPSLLLLLLLVATERSAGAISSQVDWSKFKSYLDTVLEPPARRTSSSSSAGSNSGGRRPPAGNTNGGTRPAPSTTPVDPNERFEQCCEQTVAVPSSCYRHCNYDRLNRNVILAIGAGTDACPKTAADPLFNCANQKRDHTACCRAKGVHEPVAKCVSICEPFPVVDNSFLPCLRKFETIMLCLKEAPGPA